MRITAPIRQRTILIATALAAAIGLGGCTYDAGYPAYSSAGVAYGSGYGGGYYYAPATPVYRSYPDYAPYVLGGLGLAIGGAIIASHDHDHYGGWHGHRDFGHGDRGFGHWHGREGFHHGGFHHGHGDFGHGFHDHGWHGHEHH